MSQTLIRAHLDRVKSSELFQGRQRRCALLDYLVNEELEGRGDRIKAFTIGVDVMGKGDDFDPSVDSIVRVEISRLRDALDLYYARDDADGTLRIEIPKGAYRPKFTFADSVPGSPEKPGLFALLPRRAWIGVATLLVGAVFIAAALFGEGSSRETTADDYLGFTLPDFDTPRVAVFPLKPVAMDENLGVLAHGLSVDTITEISRFSWLTVFFDTKGQDRLREPAAVKNWDYELHGETQVDDINLRVTVRLLDSRTGQVLWADAYTKLMNAANMIEIQQAIALQIALTVARRDGVIAQLEERRIVRDTTRSTTAYACVLRTYHYWRKFLKKEHFKVRACLERTIPDNPTYAEAHAALAFMYLDERRYGTNIRKGYDPLVRAREHASKAFNLNPLSALAAQALFTVQSQLGDKVEFRQVGQTALRNAPNNPELLADFGNKLALGIGEWRAGTQMTLRAINLNPDAPGWYFISPAFNAYRLGDYERAISWSEKMNLPDFFLYQIIRIACFQRLGQKEKVKFHLRELSRLGYANLNETVRYLEGARLERRLSQKLLSDVSAAFEFSS